jgi:DNA-binding response OmpR family regulator
MVTARDAVDARIADSDLRRRRLPGQAFDFGELLARLRALIRRGGHPLLPERLTVGALTLNTRSRRVQILQRDVSLTAREYALLEYLVRRAGDVVTRTDIAEHVWDEHYDPLSNVVDVYVQWLRAQAGSAWRRVVDPHAARRGYQLVADKPGEIAR